MALSIGDDHIGYLYAVRWDTIDGQRRYFTDLALPTIGEAIKNTKFIVIKKTEIKYKMGSSGQRYE